MNGSRSARSTPAKARRTGKPSPSNPRGALVTCSRRAGGRRRIRLRRSGEDGDVVDGDGGHADSFVSRILVGRSLRCQLPADVTARVSWRRAPRPEPPSTSAPRPPRRPPTSAACTPPTGRLGRGGGTVRGLVRRGGRADPRRRVEPVSGRAGADRRPARACRRAIHLQCAGGRDTLSLWNLGADEVVGRRLQPADARARPAADRGHRRARRAGSRRTSWTCPTSSTAPADLVYTGRGSIIWLQDLDAWAAVLAPAARAGRPARDLRRAPRGVAVRRRRGRAAGRSPTTTTSAARRPRAAGPRSTSTGCPSPTTSSTGSSRGRGRSARSSRRCCGPGLRIDEVAEHPVDWWAGHRDVRPEERGRVPLSFSMVATR